MNAEGTGAPLLRFSDVAKRFGGTLAVDGVSFAVGRGEVVALLGENGAGKSTLIKILAGIHAPDRGTVEIKGTAYAHRPAGGQRQPVAFIHQDLGLVEWMTLAENMAMTLGFPRRLGLVDWRTADRRARDAMARIGLDLDPATRVGRLSRTEKSLLAIARALAVEPEILVLDEPTASLPADEVERLFAAVRSLRARGVGMIYVSHRLDEVFAIADRVAVLRDGRLVGERAVAATSPGELVELIVGRRSERHRRRKAGAAGAALLEVRGLVVEGAGPVDLSLAAGEILGLVGLRGAGQTRIGRALFGALPVEGGTVRLVGREHRPRDPRAALEGGVGLVAGDRTEESLGTGLAIRENIFLNPAATGRALTSLRTKRRERAEARRIGQRFAVRPNRSEQPIETLSGGNQQKVVLARWFAAALRLLILEEPTAGVDVGAKAEIYALMDEAGAAGTGLLVVSTDFEEVATICDRALVFSRGRVVASLDRADLSPEALLHAASAGEHDAGGRAA